MRTAPLTSLVPTRHREALCRLMPTGGLAVLNANDHLPTNADGTLPFYQNSDLFYLTNVQQEQTILLLFPHAKQPEYREILFLLEGNPLLTTWEGSKLSKEEARVLSGVQNVCWLSEFEGIFSRLTGEATTLCLNANEHYRACVTTESRDARFIKWCKARYPLHEYSRLAPLLHSLRAVKDEEEIARIQKACDLTGEAFHRALRFVRAGVKEYEVEAEYLHEFVRKGSRGFSYAPIIASGRNACVLHYTENAGSCRAGDVLLMDVGAEYGSYCADMTRCLPVSGRFTPRQRAVYRAVLDVQRAAKGAIRPGKTLVQLQKGTEDMMKEKLGELGLFPAKGRHTQSEKDSFLKKYFMHGVSHHIGLDVHDVTPLHQPLQPGMVITVEPGLYIREEGLGLRLENIVVVTKDGSKDLMEDIPIEPEAIEELMTSHPPASGKGRQ